jgi:hypothetical protein
MLVCAILLGALFAVPLLVSAHSVTASSTAGTPDSNTYCVQRQQDLAKKLNVSVQTLQQDNKAVAEDQLNQLVKDGKLTQTQANKIKARIESHPNCTGKGVPYQKLVNRLFFAKYRSDILTLVANDLHITKIALVQQLHSGKSLATIAKTHNVSLSQLRTDVLNAIKSAESKAVAAGTMTQTQANDLNTFSQNHPTYVTRILEHHAKTHSTQSKTTTSKTTTTTK